MQINKDSALDGLKGYADAVNLSHRQRVSTGYPGAGDSAAEDDLSMTRHLSLLAGAVSADSVDREQRIEQLASQYDAGTYQVDSTVVARLLVGEWLARPEDF
jgi:anti-sigma28 factor (negative regulator of flagellin synthesis)